ncbi:MAG: hypothetical protein DRR00_07295 [Candidatus Parabeggiatoa sp. nov. 3]|nr:MAG: hypothetical protein DRR00_07295 [Gammaproteobacteria bacterium]
MLINYAILVPNSFYSRQTFRSKFILQSADFSFQLHFAVGLIGVQNLFCSRPYWSAKFILQSALLECKIYFAVGLIKIDNDFF